MRRLMISAMGSDSGKTVVTCGLLTLLKRRGYCIRSVKCGPDYIDPMFHSRVLGVEGANADLFLMGEDTVRRVLGAEPYHEDAAPGSLILAEGAMGLYDGIGGTTDNSAWDIADRTDTPVLLVLRSRGQSISLAAQVLGFMNFRRPCHISGLLLTECSSRLYDHLRPILERETGLPVLGYLPFLPEAEIPSRHLGLVTAEEIGNLRERFEAVADQMERTLSVDSLVCMFGGTEEEASGEETTVTNGREASVSGEKDSLCRIAVARDEAFCFYYRESIEAIRKAGAEPVFFSPLHDKKLPDGVSGLYLGGGYPELYAEELSDNKDMIFEIRQVIRKNMPVIAECGGFLYLQKELEDEKGKIREMAGIFAGTGRQAGRLVRFGYLRMTAESDSLLFRRGEVIPAHEFHHWDTDDNGTDLAAVKARGGPPYRCVHVNAHMYAGFPHVSLGGEIPLAKRFVEAACLHW